MPLLLRALPLLLAFALVACDSGDPDDMTRSDVEIGGEYSAVTETLSNGQTTTTFDIPTTADGESFSYTVTLRTQRGSDVTMNTSNGTGSYDFPNVSFTTDGTPLSGTVESDGAVLIIANPNGGTFTFRR